MWAVRSPYKKGPFYDAVRFDPERDNLVSMRDDELHNELRAKMASGVSRHGVGSRFKPGAPADGKLQYSGKENDGLEATIDREVLSFIDLLERKYISTDSEFRPVDMAYKAQFFTLDVITSLAFGKKFGYTTQDTDVYSYIKMTEESMPVMMCLAVFPMLARILQMKIFRRLMPSEHDRVGFGAFIA